MAELADPDSLETKVTEHSAETSPKWRLDQEQERTKREQEVSQKIASTQSSGDVLQVFEAELAKPQNNDRAFNERARGVADESEELLSMEALAAPTAGAARVTQAPAPVAVPAPAPVAVSAPAPVSVPAPAPVAVSAPAPVLASAPASVAVPAPAPVVVPTPAPVVASAPAPVVASAPMPAAAAPVAKVTPAPVLAATPAPAQQPAPAPTATPEPASVTQPLAALALLETPTEQPQQLGLLADDAPTTPAQEVSPQLDLLASG
jgi:hypothetical protein